MENPNDGDTRQQRPMRPMALLGWLHMATDDELPDTIDNTAFDPQKARHAARDPKRPGERCRAPTGSYRPSIDRNRCEGKAACVAVCPFGVFEVRRIDDDDFRRLSWLGRLKSRAHRRLTVYAPHAAACHACGLCVVACPERAITLQAPQG